MIFNVDLPRRAMSRRANPVSGRHRRRVQVRPPWETAVVELEWELEFFVEFSRILWRTVQTVLAISTWAALKNLFVSNLEHIIFLCSKILLFKQILAVPNTHRNFTYSFLKKSLKHAFFTIPTKIKKKQLPFQCYRRTHHRHRLQKVRATKSIASQRRSSFLRRPEN